MWILVFFDLPTETKKDIKEYTIFRKSILWFCNSLKLSLYTNVYLFKETIQKQNIKETTFSHFSCFLLFLWLLLVAF